jgi:ABC-2 type transport system permease protein
MRAVYMLTLRQLSGRWRLTIMTVLAAMPVVITLLMVASPHAAPLQNYERVVLSAILAASIAPLVVLATGAAAFGNELEDRTLANLTLSPTPRWRIALPKLLAVISVAGPFIAVSAAVTANIAFLGDVRATVAVTVSALAGVAMYAAIFSWLGLVSPQAIGIGLGYIVLWEGFFTGYVAGARLLSIRHYALALVHAIDNRRFADMDLLSGTSATALAIAIVGGSLWLTVRRLRRMDVP